MEHDERRRVARREGRDGLKHAVLRPGCLRRVPGKEVVAGLLRRELAHGREHTEGIAGQHDDVARLAVDDGRDARVRDEVDRVCAACVLRDADVVVVRLARERVVHDVLEDGAEADRIEDLGLLLARKPDTLGVASTLDVEDTGVGPDVLVVTDEEACRVRTQSRLAGARETKEERNIAVLLSDIRGRVQGQLPELDRLEIVLQSPLAKGA